MIKQTSIIGWFKFQLIKIWNSLSDQMKHLQVCSCLKESFFPCSFTFKIILGITFGILLYQCVLLTWEISLAKQVENNSLEMLQKSYVSKSEDGMVKIYWAVNGMKQDDPILIEFIRENVLVKPSYASTNGLFINTWFQKRGREEELIKSPKLFLAQHHRSGM